MTDEFLDMSDDEVFGTFVNEFGETLFAVVSRDEDWGREPWLLLVHSDAPDNPVTIGTHGEVDDLVVSAEERAWLMAISALWLMRKESERLRESMKKEGEVEVRRHPRLPGGLYDR